MTTMKQVMDAGTAVVEAHAKLLKASDALADVMEYDRDRVLRRVLLTRAEDRRNSKNVLDFLETQYDAIEGHLKRVANARARAAARLELLAKLNLTEAEKKLLGITIENL